MGARYDVVVLGGGKAGSQLVASLRDEGYAGSVLLVCAEEELPYDRPPLSKGFITGDMDAAALALREPEYYHGQNVDVWTACEAQGVDVEAHIVRTGRGEVGYGHLVIATGAELRRLPLDGADAENVLGLKDLSDAHRLRAELERARHVVVIGGGFIGLEVAAAAATRFGCEVTLVEALPRIMARTGSPETAAFVHGHHVAELGVDVRTNTPVVALERGAGDRVTAITTAEGERIPADLVVYGIGVIPRTGFADGTDIVVANGFVVDEALRASAPDVWAIGDCASFPIAATGVRMRLESVQNATDQARCVAAQIASGEPRAYDAVPWFWSDQATLKIQSAGILHPDDRRVVVPSAGGGFSVLAFREGVFVGGDSVNAPGDHLAVRRLLGARPELRAAITPDRAEAEGFDLRAAVKEALAGSAGVAR